MAIFHGELVDYDSNLAQLRPIGAGPEIHGDGPVDGGSNKTLCVHIYIIYIYIYIYIYMCVCMNIYIYIHSMYMHVYMNVHM